MSKHQLNAPPFEAGQKVWVHLTIGGRGQVDLREAVITKVGRKWVDLDQSYLGRFDCGTMQLDGKKYGSPGKVYRAPEAFHTEAMTQRLWSELARRIPISRPEDVSIDTIRQVADLLSITLPAV